MCRNLAYFGLLLAGAAAAGATKPALTLDDLFSFVSIKSAKLSPDGESALVVTTRADWKNNRFRDDLWLWKHGHDGLTPLAQSGHDSEGQWSPDGTRIAFISDRALDAPGEEGSAKKEDDKEIARVWIIDLAGGEPFPLYREPLKVHTFAWTPDGANILFSAQQPLRKATDEAKTREWKDVKRWREDDRGDLLLSLPLAGALPNGKPLPVEQPRDADAAKDATKASTSAEIPSSARVLTSSPFAIGEIAPRPDGKAIAFLTNSVSGRLEHPNAYEIYLLDTEKQDGSAKRITNNQALERQLRWSGDSKTLFFGVFAASGSLEGKYRDVQGRLYSLDLASLQIRRLGGEFAGSWTDYSITNRNALVALGQLGTEVQAYSVAGSQSTKLEGKTGSYEGLATAEHAQALLFRHSSFDSPTELFWASDPSHLNAAARVTDLNSLLRERDLPRMKTYRWKSADNRAVEGVLIYPPGRYEDKHLRMLTLIHGGPADADGNKFGADWYSWAALAATKGWLVFQPNYRGSSGYGDDFMTAISPHIVSAPGQDILAGVDALVKDGSADPDHLAVGGYSYGGYMTNWLITQTTRFRSAVTGAGAVEHASNWGNDDLTFDDAWYLGGLPWQQPATYQSEAALFQFDKVKTPTHVVMGADDVRVSASQDYLLERALDALQIPHELLVFPGEGHGLGKDPWHGYIKVREELKWLEKYDAGASPQP